MTDTIPVPRAWLERLIKLSDKVEESLKGSKLTPKPDLNTNAIHLVDYVSSAESLLTNGEKGKE